MKKLLSVLLAAVMLLAMAGVAMAANSSDTGTITVDKVEKKATVSAYKLIEMTYDNEEVTGSKWVDAVKTWVDTHYSKYSDVSNFSKATPNELKDFYDKIANAIKGGELSTLVAAETDNSDAETRKLNVTVGNYIILVSGGVNVYSPMAASVQYKSDWTVEDTTVEAKKSTPSLEKNIKVADDKLVKSDTVKIGDTVKFVIEADVPEYPSNARDRTFVIGDVQSAGLTYKRGTLKVYDVTGKTVLMKGTHYDLDDGDSVAVATGNGTTVAGIFNVNFKLDQTPNMRRVRIEYDAVVNEDVEIGTDNNTNDAHLKYSTNPYETNNYNYKEDKVKVYSYGIQVLKWTKGEKEARTPLAGAQFRLYAELDSTTKDVVANSEIKMVEESHGVYRVAKENESGVVMVTDDNGQIQIKGLKGSVAGITYYLKETKAPAGGYTKLTTPALVTIKVDSATMRQVTEPAGTSDILKASVKAEVENKKGSLLPSTGGMGTTIFMVAGIAVMACAVVALMVVLKRQKHSEG